MPYVGYVEFNVPDPEKTASFFSDVFGWEPQAFGDEGYLSVQHGSEPGIDTGISQHDGPPQTVATLLVDDLDASMDAVVSHGGTITVPKFPIPGVGHGCYFTDPQGMMVGMWEADAS